MSILTVYPNLTLDYTTWTETDPNSRISVAARKIDFINLSDGENSWVYKDFGVDFFSENFTHKVDIKLASGGDGEPVVPWQMTNDVDDLDGIDAANGSGLFVQARNNGGGANLTIVLTELDSGDKYEDNGTIIGGMNTDYYLTIKRDEAVGTYGTFYCYIYSDSARAALVDTLTITLATSKKDYRYLFGLSARNYGGTGAVTGYTQNLRDVTTNGDTVDGQVWMTSANTTLNNLRNETGSNARDNLTSEAVYLEASTTENQYKMLTRLPLLFDITSIPADSTIESAVLSLYIESRSDGLSGAASDNSKIVLDECDGIASDTSLTALDFDITKWGGSDMGRSVKQASLTDDQYNDITINSTGITYLNGIYAGTKIARFGLRYAFDFDNTTTGLTWASGAYNYIEVGMADNVTAGKKPKLVITYNQSSYDLPAPTSSWGLKVLG